MIARLLRSQDRGFLRLLLRDSMLAGIAAGLSRVFVFALSVAVSRFSASQSEFGVFSSALLLVQLVAMIGSLGLAQTAAQAIAVRAHDPARQAQAVRSLLLLAVALASITALGLMFAAALVERAMEFHVPERLLRWTSLLVLLQLFAAGLEGILRGLRSFRALPVAAAGGTMAALLLGYPLAKLFGALGGLGALGLFLAVQSAIMLAPLRHCLLGPVLPLREAGAMLGRVAAPTFLSGLFWNIAMLVPPLLLIRSRTGLVDVALWNASSQLRTIISFAPIVIVNATIPHLVERTRAGSLSKRQALTSVTVPMAAALVPYLPAVIFARPLMALYGAEYSSHATLLVLVASYVLLQVLGVGLFAFVLASGKVWQAAILNLLWCASVLAATPYVIESGGVYALARVYLLTYIPVDAILALLALRALQAAWRGLPARPAAVENPAQA